jgi:hypothetical protein
MLLALIGLAICLWVISTGFGAPALGRATMFVGPLGFIVNIILLLIGVGLIALGFGLLPLFFPPQAETLPSISEHP